MLRQLGIQTDFLFQSLTRFVQSKRHRDGVTEPVLSPVVTRVLKLAAAEADRLLGHDIDTGHLLAAIMRREKCVAAVVLLQYSVTLTAVRRQASRFRRHGIQLDVPWRPAGSPPAHTLLPRRSLLRS